MLHSKSFVKKTRRGTVLKVVREHYLRDDISCGATSCNHEVCSTDDARENALLNSEAKHILVVDTNVALHQIDFLENPDITNVVVLSVVLEEVKHKNLSAFNRLRALCSNKTRSFFVFANEHHKETFIKAESGESPNDRNDRAIRKAAKWYFEHLGPSVNILLLTNDMENLRKARSDGLNAKTVYEYVQSLGKPELLDLVVGGTGEDGEAENPAEEVDGRNPKRKAIFEEHKPMSEISAGLKRGVYYQGKLRVNRYNCFSAHVGSEGIGDEILVDGRSDMNRAVDGDFVVVELFPKEQWKERGASKLHDIEVEEPEEETVGLAPDVVEEAPQEQPPEGKVSTLNGSGGESSFARPTGRVVGIIKRNWRPYCGSLEPMKVAAKSGSTQSALFVCAGGRIPKIRIQTRQLETLLSKRIMVSIDTWERTSSYPSGHYVRTIGDIGDKVAETEVVLIENDINTQPFTEQVLACLPPLPWSMPQEELASSTRADLRSVGCFSVDPPGCRDIDDALHCTRLPNGNFQVGVHIADVTNFVLPGSALDEEASRRGTSVYLVERRIDMLPKPLTEDICSLRADVERLAFSVLWEMTSDAKVVSANFTKSVIKSRAAMSYQEAQSLIDDIHEKGPIATDLRNMNRLAKIMRERRIQNGALTLASPEVKFVIDTETHDPLDVGMYQLRETNQMVEEFMLAANVAVAEKILAHFPSCSLLRRHPSPSPKMLEPLLRTATAVGVKLDISSSKALADSLDLAVSDDPLFNKLIRILATRCMTQAVYFPSGELPVNEYHHYGLAAAVYTHFTSPIRRYADVLVHRLLAASLDLSPLPVQMWDKAGTKALSDNLNYRHRNAQMAGRASVELYTLVFFRTRPSLEEARVVGVRSNGLVVFVPKYGIEGPVYLTAKHKGKKDPSDKNDEGTEKDGMWIVDEEHLTVVSVDGKIRYKVLDRVTVRIVVEEIHIGRPKLCLNVVQKDG